MKKLKRESRERFKETFADGINKSAEGMMCSMPYGHTFVYLLAIAAALLLCLLTFLRTF